MNTKAHYYALQAELEIVERATGLYLIDEIVDQENSIDCGPYESEEFWDAMCRSARFAAVDRAASAGRDINELLGKIIG